MHTEWSQIRCKAGELPDKASMLENGPSMLPRLRIPFDTNYDKKTNAQWSLWTSWEEPSPTFPLYMPNPRSGSQRAMVDGKGKAKTPQGTSYNVPKKFAKQVYAEWRKF